MAVTQDRPGPYAPASAILSLMDKDRKRGLPSPIDGSVLERAGVSPSLIPRTLQALQTLNLIEDNGARSDVLESLRLAPEGEYKKRMSEWLTDAYAEALQFVDPATASETDIRDAFRKYTPTGQQDRMVSLFIGLFTAAGVMPPRERTSAPRAANVMPRAMRPAPKPKGGVRINFGGGGSGRGGGAGAGSGGSGIQSPIVGLPPALSGLLQSLPANGKSWTQAQRDKFYKTFGAVLDFCIPIGEPEPEPAPDNETADDLA